MCLSIPGRVVRVHGTTAQVEVDGRARWFTTLAQPDVKEGDYVVTHANLIIAIVTGDEARQTWQLAGELRQCLEAEQATGDRR